MPEFSIIVPTRNRANLLKECLESIVNQVFESWELIVVDDGSTDNTKDIVYAFTDSRIRYFYQKHGERSKARNLGLSKIKGQNVCFVDDDDTVSKNYLSDFNEAYKQHSNKAILRTNFIRVNEDGIKTGVMYDSKKHKNAINYLLNNMCGMGCVCFPSEIVKNLKFPEQFPHWQDTYFIALACLISPLIQLENTNYYYRIHKQMGSQKVISERHLNQRALINVEAMIDFENKYFQRISSLVEKNLFKRLRAEKFLEYAIIAKINGYSKLAKDLYARSLKQTFSFSLWKLYLRFWL